MEKQEREMHKGVDKTRVRGYFGSNQWMDAIAEAMDRVEKDPNLSEEERRKQMDEYRIAMRSIN